MATPLLFQRHFQLAYVTHDLAAAQAVMADHYGITRWQVLDLGAMGDQSPASRIAMTWVGDRMIEVIEANAAVQSLYTAWMPQGDAALRFHHLGFLIDDADAYVRAREHLTGCGHVIAAEGSFGDTLDYFYADTTAALGHFYEVIRLKPAGQDFFKHVPEC
jgi:hypothetical protein